MSREIITLCSPRLSWRTLSISNPRPVALPRGVTVLFGPNGAGKSTLGRIIEKGWNVATNRITTPEGRRLSVKMMEFGDIHSLSGFHTEYYQQRLESSMNDDVPTVAHLLAGRMASERWSRIEARFGIAPMLEKRVNYLSSGELRKLLLANAMVDAPDVLILDNPYIGLDAASRPMVDDALRELTDEGVAVVLLLCNPDEIPDFADLMLPIAEMAVGKPLYRADGVSVGEMRQAAERMLDYDVDLADIPERREEVTPHDVTFALEDCRVVYGKRTVLERVNWTAHRGEGWALSGRNGAGKSLLLSLLYADNPQAYSNRITIFDRRRGSGESIWDIKRRIGYVSPEMQLYFRSSSSLVDVVAQGLRDTVGNFGRVTPEARAEAMRWLQLFRLEHVAEKSYRELSAGTQRLALIARTFVKHPDLLIFDEPLHGLDAARKRAVRAVLDTIARRDSPTIVYVTHQPSEIPASITHRFTL